MGSDEMREGVEYIDSCLRDIEVAAFELRKRLTVDNIDTVAKAQVLLDQTVKNVDWILNHRKDAANVQF